LSMFPSLPKKVIVEGTIKIGVKWSVPIGNIKELTISNLVSINYANVNTQKNKTCFLEIKKHLPEDEHFITCWRKPSIVLRHAKYESTCVPTLWAMYTSFPNVMPLTLISSKGSRQSKYTHRTISKVL
jgi:hypothetical protein